VLAIVPQVDKFVGIRYSPALPDLERPKKPTAMADDAR
jgi:hypothetical protein